MTTIAKLYAQALGNPRGISFREFERLLAAFGFEHVRTAGSHRHYKHPTVPALLTVLPERKNAKAYQVRRLLDMVDEFGLRFEA